jgi:hypothetical protein
VAVIQDNQTISSNVSGFKKKIDESAATMMLDNLQTFMYQKPIQSCVRECASNALDAVKEKRMAIAILSGEAKISDYYVEKETIAGQSDIYRDSKFNPEYYDLKWLNLEDKVTLDYFNNEQNKRDVFTITDTGVGLGGRRLEGFFNLGYSSKRLNSKELGGFGLGAKSPLATGVESYRLLTRYNGKEFCFDIYSHKVDCVYSKWNEDGSTNEFYEFEPVHTGDEPDSTDENGVVTKGKPIYHTFKAYYKNTLEKNSTSIIIEVKKHNRNQYFEAVKSQLMYIKENIVFYERYFGGDGISQINFKANILFEDDHVIVSDYNYYRSPHFVLKNIGYGVIDWGECELTPRRGNIGIKVQMENIDVLPSREAVVYSPKTRDATVEECKWVNDLVTSKVSATLKQDTILDWIRACNRVMYHSSSSVDYISILSEFAERSQMKPQFKDTGIYFQSDIDAFLTPLIGMEWVHTTSEWDYKLNKRVSKTKRDKCMAMTDFNREVYFQFGAGDARTTQYLLAKHQGGGFSAMRAHGKYHYLDPLFADLVSKTITLDEAKAKASTLVKAGETDQVKAKAIIDNALKALEVISHMVLDPAIKIYSPTLVPDDFVAKSEDEEPDYEAISEAQRKDAQKERERIRRENKQFIVSRMSNKRRSSGGGVSGVIRRDEIYASELDMDTCTVVYCNDEDTETMENLLAMARYAPSQSSNDRHQEKLFYWNDELKILRVAKSNMRYVKGATHLDKWLLSVDDSGKLTTYKTIADKLTANMLKEVLGTNTKFLTNFGEFDIDLSLKYNKLRKFMDAQIADSYWNQHKSPVFDTLQDAAKKQITMFKTPPATNEERDALLGTTLVSKGVQSISIVDEEMFQTAMWIKNFADVFSCLLGYIGPLSDDKRPVLRPNLVTEIKGFIATKRDQLEGEYPSLVS